MIPRQADIDKLIQELGESLYDSSPHVRAAVNAVRGGMPERDALIDLVRALHEYASSMKACATRAVELDVPGYWRPGGDTGTDL